MSNMRIPSEVLEQCGCEMRSKIGNHAVRTSNKEIRLLKLALADSLSGLAKGYNQVYELRSSLITRTYFNLLLTALPIYMNSIDTGSLAFCPCNSMASAREILSPVLEIIQFIEF